ncbi:BLUF domain-containing protein [Brevundimonas sp. SORGH_AS_0993]|uniref:BLUF domain-containing protein n=1 Tax=Brevundimonas sp. SORGH_AS_0993 TaxID=3041794 RepID=UPI0027D83594|nr:BLUF domain-containing protein [Brevundimonas sp. SORGH_AS_0993]
MPLEHLIYKSRSAMDYPSDQSLSDILSVSDRNNRRDGVTGGLVVAARTFLQVLEGDGATLDHAMTRLHADPRHADIVILNRQPIAQRRFEGWAMIGAAVKPTRDIVMDELAAFAQFDPDYVIDRMLTLLADRFPREATRRESRK